MSKKTLNAFIVSFVLLITVIMLNRISFREMKDYTFLVDHTQNVITGFESISKNFKSAQIYTSTYKGDSLKNFYDLYKKDAEKINPELAYLKKMVNDNPVQKRRVDSLTVMVNKHLPLLMHKNIVELINTGEGWRLNELFAIHGMIDRGIEHEKALLRQRKKELNSFTHLNGVLSITFSILAIVILVATFVNIFIISKKRKWLEGFLESILNTSQGGVANYKSIRQDGKIVDFKIEFLNNAIEDLFGEGSTIHTGKKLSEVSKFAMESDLLNKFIEVVETGNPLEFETLYRKNKVEHWLLVSLVKLDDGVTASFYNITQLKNSQEELKNKIVDLERSNAELEQYAYVASHDLQEPLRKIRSFGSYLQDTELHKLDERGQQLLAKIMSSAERMSSLIKDILSFSSLKKESDFVPVNLNEIVKSAQHDLDLLITQKKATIESETLPTIEAIPLQMTQLFYNLLNNSLKFAKENEAPSIKISCEQMHPEDQQISHSKEIRYYKIVITDNGIGFNAEHGEQIFGLFKRLNNKQLYSGSGIGLALCKKVIENHNGEIFAVGKEGEGASFHIYLPEKQP